MFSIGAFAIIFDENGKVLLSHRRDIDAWNLPGGGVETRELPDEAVIREVREETGLEVIIERLVGVYGKVDTERHCPAHLSPPDRPIHAIYSWENLKRPKFHMDNRQGI
jgi:8-oxo-dGTP pyrophosphatase MutT (NUDIX family)